MELAGRHIVVTGGASGIGRACALRFADEDAKVTVSDLNGEGAEQTAGEIGATRSRPTSATRRTSST